MSDSPAAPSGTSPLLAWLRLLRAPNVFTALADVAMGFLVVHGSLEPLGLLVCLASASALLYMAGMVLNDVFDLDVDARERPFRPLPSGQISLALARAIGLAMLAGGTTLGVMAGVLYANAFPWRSGLVAGLLAGCILLYDAWLKRTPLGPLGMGLCRFLNILLAMSVGPAGAGLVLGYSEQHLLPAAGIGLYIVGVTIFAKGEAGKSDVKTLLAGMGVMVAGGVFLGWGGAYFGRQAVSVQIYWLLVTIMMATQLRRCLSAVFDPSSDKVQAGVKSGIMSLVLLDAAVALSAADPFYSLAIVALLAPMLILGRWVYST